MFFATQDTDEGFATIAANAEIRAFETLEAARSWLLSPYDADDFHLATAEIIPGEFSDCWLKLSDAPSDSDLAAYGAPFAADDLSVQRPGQHPGGRRWWVTPRSDVLVLASIQQIEGA